MPDIRITMTVHHDATDPAANDTTMDLNELLIEKLFKDLDDFQIIEQDRQSLIIQFQAPVTDPSRWHVED